jgi:hypothetical protein
VVPLYAARVSDLKPGDFVRVECGACGHDGLIHPSALASLGLGPDDRVVDLEPRLRCRGCDAKGKAVVSVMWTGP